MKLFDSFRQAAADLLAPTQRNSFDGRALARDFFNNGPQRYMAGDWAHTLMSDRDKFTGYLYAAIDRRVTKVKWLAEYNLKTQANDATAKAAKANKQDLQHPYLPIIEESTTFTDDAFWEEIQTYLDIKGVYYLMAIRGKLKDKVGEVKEFKLLNPYDITVTYDYTNLEVIGYVESREGMYREIPPHMIIPMRKFNPFSRKELFSMADAAKDAQFTLKEATEQMRTTVRRNRRYPGVALLGNGGAALDPEQVVNFKSRMRGKSGTDEPMFMSSGATGKGTIAWNDMQVDLRKSSVDMVNEIQLNELIAVSGVSKTKLGIEQSGVTRDTADIQEGLFISDQAMPALQRILSFLNQDYKTNYPDKYKRYGYKLYVDSPLKDDKEAEKADVDIRTSSFELYTTLRDAGYDHDTASAYASGEKALDDIGEPTEEPKPVTVIAPPATDQPAEPATDPTKNNHHHHNDPLPVIRNDIKPSLQATIDRQESALRNAVISVQHQVVAAVLNHVQQNKFDSQSDIIDAGDRDRSEAKLEMALETFYSIIIPINASSVMSRRTAEFGLLGTFHTDAEVSNYVTLTASRAASSHMDTILGDILTTVQDTEERLVQDELKKITPLPGQSSEEVLQLARKKALEGVGREQVAAAIRQTYGDTITKTRANTIARTETTRAFNRAQYEADRQFLDQNDLRGKAYKKWVTRSDDPCPYCVAQSKLPAIPFDEPWARVGDVLSATFKKADGTTVLRQMQVGFEDCLAAEIHPNGHCTYQLIIQ